MGRLVLCALVAMAVLAPPSRRGAHGEEPLDPSGIARRAFPAPSARHAFQTTFDLRVEGRPYGSLELRAEPVEMDGTTLWRLHERVVLDGKQETERESFLDAELAGLRGTASIRTDGEAERVAWTYEAGRIVVRPAPAPGDAAAEPSAPIAEYDAPGRPVPGLAALALYCRLVPEEPAKHDVEVHDVATRAVRRTTVDMRGPAMWTAGSERFRVWLVVLKADDKSMRLAFSFPGRHELVGLDAGAGNPAFVRRLADGAGAMPDLSAAAATPEAAAIKLAVGLASLDEGLLRAAFHWPTLHAAARKRDPATSDVLETFTATTIAQLRAGVKAPQSRAEAEAAVLRGLANRTVVLDPERPDRAEVVLHVGGAARASRVSRIDGVWHVVPAE